MQKVAFPSKVSIAQGPRGPFLVDQVELTLREKVAQLRHIPNARLPEEKVLAKTHGVSVKTIRCALERLRNERIIRSIRGKGTFVSSEPNDKPRQVLLISDKPQHPYNMMAVGTISALLNGQGIRPNLLVSSNPQEELETAGTDLSGTVLIGGYSRDVLSRLAQAGRVPLVYLGDLNEPIRGECICDNVLADFRAVGYRAADYLLRQGHRRIGVCGWGLARAFGRDLIQGYRNAFEQHQVPLNEAWLVDFPQVPFGQRPSGELFHQPLGSLQRKIDQLFESGEAPTALIHNSASELQVRDMLHYYFHDHFSFEQTVAVVHSEHLETGYTGLGDGTAVCVRFEDIARRALELLFRPRSPNKNTPPIREFQEQVFIYHRKNGIWAAREETEQST